MACERPADQRPNYTRHAVRRTHQAAVLWSVRGRIQDCDDGV
jgi:hypothetical protein